MSSPIGIRRRGVWFLLKKVKALCLAFSLNRPPITIKVCTWRFEVT